MAALPYMQLYVAEYLADTTHLTAAQHGAYLLLLMNYWTRGKALPNDDSRLAVTARMTVKEWAANKTLLSEFFTVSETEWLHARVERDLSETQAKCDAKKANGKQGGRPRKPNGFDSVTKTEPKQKAVEEKRKEEKITPKPPEGDFSGDMVAQQVLCELAISGQQLRVVLDDVCRMELDRGAEPLALLEQLTGSWRDYSESKPALQFQTGAAKFFGEGLWRDRSTWPWKPQNAPAPVAQPRLSAAERQQREISEYQQQTTQEAA